MLGRLARGPSVVIAIAAAAPAARAQGDAELQKQAGELVQRGIALQSQKDTEGAVALYRQAYCLIPEPALVYNMGTAYQEAAHLGVAASYFRLYLKVAPTGELAPDAKAAIKNIGSKSANVAVITCEKPVEPCPDGAARVDGACPAPTPTCGPDQDLIGGQCVARTISGGTDAASDHTTEGTVSRPGRGLFWAGVVTAGAGAIGLGVGVAYGIKAKNASDALSNNTGPWTPELLAKQEEGKSAERNQIIFTAVGGAALVGGVVMVFLGLRDHGPPAEGHARIVPYATGDQAGVALTGSY